MKNANYRLLLDLSFVMLVILLGGCAKEDLTSTQEASLKVFYKIEHSEGQYPYPVNPLGPVVTTSGYIYEIENGGTIYIKDSTELDFWLNDSKMKTAWTIEHVGHGSSIISNTSTLKTSFIVPGEFLLTINTPRTTRIKILVH